MSTEHRFKDEWLVRLLEQDGSVQAARIEQWRHAGVPFISQQLLDDGALTFDQLSALIQRTFHIGSTDLAGGVAKDTAGLVPEKVARQHFVVAVEASQRNIDVAMANPLDEYAMQAVSAVTGRKVNPLFCPPTTVERATLDELTPDAIVYNLLRKFETQTNVEVVERESELPVMESTDTQHAPVVQLANNIIGAAVHRNASDIHIEHDETSTLVRYRLDGLLKNVMVLPRYVGAGPLVSRIKIMAGLDVSDRLRPQDGRAKLKVGSDLIGLRVSTLPARTGEKVVLRILNEKSIKAKLNQLNFHPDVLARFTAMLAMEQGIVLVTGPTGSGKTTTLYAALNHMLDETLNVVTVEDPIEYRLPGITQVQVNEKQGLTFAAVLRSVLRQDPDIVMLGEIRDAETALTAVQAALTGHLVLSTLHTNDTVGAVTRLVDIGVEPFKIASALSGVTAQRLVRRVCTACATPGDAAELPDHARAEMQRLYGRVAHVRHGACKQCNFTGFKGRLPLIELLDVGAGLRDVIAHGGADEDLRRNAVASGALHSMEADALWHLMEGRTTLEEVLPFLSTAPVASAAPVESVTPTAAVAPPAPVAAAPSAPAASVAPAAEPAPATEPPRTQPRVLIAIADPSRLAIAQSALASCDVSTTWVTSGVEALVAISSKTPDVLLVDADLPAMSAEQILGVVRTVLRLTDVSILALLAREDDARAAALLVEGAREVLAPPVDAILLQAYIEAALDSRQAWSTTAEVMKPPTPVREAARQAALDATGLLDTPAEERFDRLTREVTEEFGMPLSVISLIDRDRQWFKSRQGIPAAETPRDISFCGHAINYDDVFVVEDAYLDPRFSENPLVTGDPNVRFYAGAQLRSPEGHAIGMLCVMDHAPHAFDAAGKRKLREMAQRVEREVAGQGA